MAKVISIDLELNQPSRKIIQLGYVIGNVQKGTILLERSLIINPHEQLGMLSDKNMHITELTGINQEMVDNGIELSEAYKIMCEDIKKHNPTSTPVQWGMGDSECIMEELNLNWDTFVFRKRTFDVKALYQVYRLFTNQGVAAGLETAMNSLGMNFLGRPHDALADAKNTFLIFLELGKKMILSDKIIDLVKKV